MITRVFMVAVFAIACHAAFAAEDAALTARVDRVLAKTLLIDGHNDLPWEISDQFGSVDGVDLSADTSNLPRKNPDDKAPLMTDIPRLRAGHVGGQFWSAWISPTNAGPTAVKMMLEQIDIVKSMAARWPKDFEMA